MLPLPTLYKSQNLGGAELSAISVLSQSIPLQLIMKPSKFSREILPSPFEAIGKGVIGFVPLLDGNL